MAEHPPSLLKVAKAAGVSLATASRVLSHADYPVSDETRQRVLDAAARLNYIPNMLARSVQTKRSQLIAVLVGDNVDPYFAEIVRGVEDVASAQQYLVVVCNTGRSPERELYYLNKLQDYRVDGIIFAASGLSDPHHAERIAPILTSMQRRGAVAITLAPHQLDAPSLQPDNFGGARAMTARLIELGHTRIAFVTGPSNVTSANLRLQGYMAALVEGGLPIDQRLILPGNFERQGGEQAARLIAHMPEHEQPTAVFAANDETAFGLLLGCDRHGVETPQRLSVCGFGDLPMAQVVKPTLTTVRIDLGELGRRGAQRLLTLLEGGAVPQLEMLPTRIVERASTRARAPVSRTLHSPETATARVP